MGDLVNLRMSRKRAARGQREQRAAERRLEHGVTKADHRLAGAREDKARRDLDRHRVEPGDSQ
ncbi:MAG: DUF4169 family protein [Proteobacteria bacterium]|nr:DUF4169 family protein [Pseudomonadota bacterium]